jgi:hypothetical protein
MDIQMRSRWQVRQLPRQQLARIGLAVLVVALLGGICVGAIRSWDKAQRLAINQSILSVGSRTPPCWEGITVGETTAEEALRALQHSPYIRDGSVKETGSYTLGGIKGFWKPGGRGIVVGLRDGYVAYLQLAPYDLQLYDIVQEFGLPDALWAYPASIPERRIWGVDVYHLNLGMRCSLMASGDPLVEHDAPVKALTFVPPQTDLGALFTALGYGEKALSTTRSWLGYGPVFGLYYTSPSEVEY